MVETWRARCRRALPGALVLLLAAATLTGGALGVLTGDPGPAVGDQPPPTDPAATATGPRALPPTPAPGPVPSPGTLSPPTAQPAAPGVTIDRGRDESDPFVLVTGGADYLYTTQGFGVPENVPVRYGPAVGRWGPVRDAMPVLPTWALNGFTWAPDVHRFGDHYVLYFTAIVARSYPSTKCIGLATARSPLGPFVGAPDPFICQRAQGGSIDPRTFADADGTSYMLWKSDENADVDGTTRTNVYAQRLSADGRQLLGTPTRIFGPDEAWQGRIVEAPDLVLVEHAYWLFYSGGWYNQPAYAVGVARCAGPLGPCADISPAPLLGSNLQGTGPGEQSVFVDGQGVWMVYTPVHAADPLPTPPRPVDLVRLGFGPFGPYLAAGAQPPPVPAASDRWGRPPG